MIAYIDSANLPSIEFHNANGFRQAGRLSCVGFKFGCWTDTLLMQRSLGAGGAMPPEDQLGKTKTEAMPEG